jgi:hypothetical protein
LPWPAVSLDGILIEGVPAGKYVAEDKIEVGDDLTQDVCADDELVAVPTPEPLHENGYPSFAAYAKEAETRRAIDGEGRQQ